MKNKIKGLSIYTKFQRDSFKTGLRPIRLVVFELSFFFCFCGLRFFFKFTNTKKKVCITKDLIKLN